ncbi:MAG: hypothetical protein R3279_11895, partial [Putridiphycobacter sp.]|nr:hypothetical protein [Putridiphycobacter sp.]
MAKKKPITPKGGFNFYWIYGIVAVVIFMLMLTSSGSTGKQIQVNDFYSIADKGLVSKVVVLKNIGKAEVYLKQDKLEEVRAIKPDWKNIRKQKSSPFAEKTADMIFTTPSIENFENRLREIELSLQEKGPDYAFGVEYDEHHDYFSEILSWLFLPAILIFFWIFMMRRMGGGAGGGAGGAG